MYRLSPAYFFLNFTSACNSHCMTCDIWKLPKSETLPVDVFERIPRFFDPSRLLSVLLCGGEPLLPPSCVEMALAVNRFRPGVRLVMATNSLVPDLYLERVKAMQAGGCNVGIYLSLNGPPERHDETRGTPGNYVKVLDFAKGLRDCGALRAFNILMIPGYTQPSDIAHCQEVAHRFGVFLASSPIMRKSPWFGREDDGKTIPRFDCHAGDVLAILPNGDIVPCQEPRPNLTFANLRDEGLDETKATRILEIIKSGGCQPCGCCTNSYTQGAICF